MDVKTESVSGVCMRDFCAGFDRRGRYIADAVGGCRSQSICPGHVPACDPDGMAADGEAGAQGSGVQYHLYRWRPGTGCGADAGRGGGTERRVWDHVLDLRGSDSGGMGVFFHEGKKEPGIAGTGWIELKLGKRRLMLLIIIKIFYISDKNRIYKTYLHVAVTIKGAACFGNPFLRMALPRERIISVNYLINPIR